MPPRCDRVIKKFPLARELVCLSPYLLLLNFLLMAIIPITHSPAAPMRIRKAGIRSLSPVLGEPRGISSDSTGVPRGIVVVITGVV